jgi:hypothetical protein
LVTIGTAAGLVNFVQATKHDLTTRHPPQTWPMILAVVGVVLTLLSWTAVRFVSKRIAYFPANSLLPVIAGVIDKRGRVRIAFVRYAGTCPHDDGKLKAYRKPLTWADYTDPRSGRIKRRVTSSEPVLECRKYGGHRWSLDPTDIRHLDG